MPAGKRNRIIQAIVAVFAVPVVLYCLAYQPWDLHRGARRAEIGRPMPGDTIISDPTFNATRAITIRAEPADVWPWIVQIGYLRGGFYSHDRLDNNRVPSADEIIPEYQSVAVGDRIPLTASGFVRVVSMAPDTSFCVVYPDSGEPFFTWVWGLYPEENGRTRLVVRLRWHQEQWLHRIMVRYFEIIMMKRHLKGIRDRAEEHRASDQLISPEP